MKRRVLIIPLEEIERHFEGNSRQDVKIVAPDILTDELFSKLKARGRDAKPEQHLIGNIWRHSKANERNSICESGDFGNDRPAQYAKGPFAVSFANEKAEQDEHYHGQHLEIYFSEHPMEAEFRCLEDSRHESVKLEHGGAIIFGPEVVHRMRLSGLTMVIEVPSVTDDKTNERLCRLDAADSTGITA